MLVRRPGSSQLQLQQIARSHFRATRATSSFQHVSDILSYLSYLSPVAGATAAERRDLSLSSEAVLRKYGLGKSLNAALRALKSSGDIGRVLSCYRDLMVRRDV